MHAWPNNLYILLSTKAPAVVGFPKVPCDHAPPTDVTNAQTIMVLWTLKKIDSPEHLHNHRLGPDQQRYRLFAVTSDRHPRAHLRHMHNDTIYVIRGWGDAVGQELRIIAPPCTCWQHPRTKPRGVLSSHTSANPRFDPAESLSWVWKWKRTYNSN